MPRILMVEDSPMQIRAILSYFELTDYEIDRAERLADGIDQAKHGRFDAILLDLSLPDSHGIETFRQMQAASAGVPIVILTSTDDEDLAVQMLREGAQDYLVKGEVTSNWVQRALRYAIERTVAVTRRSDIGKVPPPPQPSLSVQQADDVTIVRIGENRLVDSDLVDQLARKLFRLVDDVTNPRFLLDCGKVDYLSNSALGQLLMWDEKIRKKGGAMRVFGLRPEVREQIRVRKLLAQFDICLDEETALSGI